LKINIIGIIGAIIVLISLALPWWTITFSENAGVYALSGSLSIYLYQTTRSGAQALWMQEDQVTGQINLWYGWVAFVLLMLGALFGVAGSLIPARVIFVLGGILALVSTIVFAAGLQNDFSSTSSLSGIGLFSSGEFLEAGYATNLSFGFWLALVGAILILAASLKKPKLTRPTVAAPTVTPLPLPAREESFR
jgi:hypothetical protein